MTTTFLKDYAERVVRTAIQAFLGVLAAGWATTGFNVTSLRALLVAAFSAAAAAIMALLTKGIGSGDTASILTPDPVDPDPVVPVDPPADEHEHADR